MVMWWPPQGDKQLLDRLDGLNMKMETIMAALDDFITDITGRMDKLDTVEASLKTFIQGLFDQIKAGVPAVTAAQQTALDAIKVRVDKEASAITDSMVAGTPVKPKV